jgi:tripartite-type tricarboxylate transporter receptor subunit TctC
MQVALATRDAKFAEQLASYGVDPLGNTPAEFAGMIADDVVIWADALRAAGIRQQ